MAHLPTYAESAPAPAATHTAVPRSPSAIHATAAPPSADNLPTNMTTEYYAQTPSYSAATDEALPSYTRRASAAPSTSSARPGYRSEEAYLAALRQWAEAKTYYQPGELSHEGDAGGLVGFYGRTTLEEYAARPGIGDEVRRRRNERRATVALARGQQGSDGPRRASEAAPKRVFGIFPRRA